MTPTDDEALAIVQGLLHARVIKEIHHMTAAVPEQTPLQTGAMREVGEDWSDVEASADTATYPELPDNPHNHVYTWSPKLPDGSMLVIRAQTAHELVDAVQALGNGALGAVLQAWRVAQGVPQAAPQAAPAVPMPEFQAAAQQQWNQQPPAQGAAPSWAAPASNPQQWQAPPQQNGGGAQSAPAGWYRLNVPFPGGTDRLKALAAQAGIPKGNPDKGGAFNFWKAPVKAWYCDPRAAQAFAEFSPTPA